MGTRAAGTPREVRVASSLRQRVAQAPGAQRSIPTLAAERQHGYHGVMNKARISDLRDHLSRYLDQVRAGGRVLILDRNRPIAEIVPVGRDGGARDADEGRLEALERAGIVRRGRRRIPSEFLKPLKGPKAAGVVDSLLEERERGR